MDRLIVLDHGRIIEKDRHRDLLPRRPLCGTMGAPVRRLLVRPPQVIEKIAAAAKALGWPEQIVDATRTHLENITKMQVQTMDQIMDAWEGQLKSPASPSGFLSKLKSFPSFGSAGGWSNGDAFQTATLAPFQAYMSFLQHWQKACKDAVASWSQLAHRTSVMQPGTLPRGMS